MAKQSRRGLIGAIASILIGAAIITYVVNLLLDTLVNTAGQHDDTNTTIAAIRPIVSAAIILVAVLAIVIVAGQMMGALGGI
jgi:hypothetical protein